MCPPDPSVSSALTGIISYQKGASLGGRLLCSRRVAERHWRILDVNFPTVTLKRLPFFKDPPEHHPKQQGTMNKGAFPHQVINYKAGTRHSRGTSPHRLGAPSTQELSREKAGHASCGLWSPRLSCWAFNLASTKGEVWGTGVTLYHPAECSSPGPARLVLCAHFAHLPARDLGPDPGPCLCWILGPLPVASVLFVNHDARLLKLRSPPYHGQTDTGLRALRVGVSPYCWV